MNLISGTRLKAETSQVLARLYIIPACSYHPSVPHLKGSTTYAVHLDNKDGPQASQWAVSPLHRAVPWRIAPGIQPVSRYRNRATSYSRGVKGRADAAVPPCMLSMSCQSFPLVCVLIYTDNVWQDVEGIGPHRQSGIGRSGCKSHRTQFNIGQDLYWWTGLYVFN